MRQSAKLVSCTKEPEKLIMYCARVSNPQNQDSGNTKLISYCIRHGHWSPFEMAHAVIEIKTTRAISPQILRHRSFSFQEFSQRYAKVEDLDNPVDFDMRLAGATNRQSSRPVEWDKMDMDQVEALKAAQNAVRDSRMAYGKLVDSGFAPETARNILPLCTPTTLYMAGNIRSWIHYVQLRTKPDTQLEHREIALKIRCILNEIVPVTMEAVDRLQDKG